uniref:DUF8040 domain-containing protein n=1 Tax=Lactuca sativa TaxID=4236 RepID=A0A9R1WDN5_LACSA|nr:hypothetical protein LSAT_V11C200076680 [Lactuca sativa]
MFQFIYTTMRRIEKKNYGLKGSDRISVKEKVGIFLYTLGLCLSIRDVVKRFQCFGEVISRDFHDVLESICRWSKGFMGLVREYIRRKDAIFKSIPCHIENESRCMSDFKIPLDALMDRHMSSVSSCIETPYMNFPKPRRYNRKYYVVDIVYPDRKGYRTPY